METQEVEVRTFDISHNGSAVHIVLYLSEGKDLNDITEQLIRQFVLAMLKRSDYPSQDARDLVSQIKGDLELLFGQHANGAIRIPKIEVDHA